jgi:16S rRNA (guanine966-N2)-methyltransferase
MRVIAGEARGLGLVSPPGVRPTAGRVREAVFASLGDVTGLRVLDLFAGSGALAIEALSRGADRALLVDRDRDATEVASRNLATTRFTRRARVLTRPVASLLAGVPPVEAPFDLVCCDPPYELPVSELELVLAGLRRPGWVGAEARVVVERAARAAGPGGGAGWGDAWVVGWERKYGDTLVTVLRPTQDT